MALIATALVSCSTSPVTVQKTYTPTASAKLKPAKPSHKGAVTAPAHCRIYFASLTDGRSDPMILGSVAGRVVLSPGDGSLWIGEMLRTGLVQYQIDTILPSPETVLEASVIADASLVTAWVASMTTSMSSNIVMSVTFQRAGSSPESKIYRGTSATMNWASGEGEIQSLVNAAFGDLLHKLGPDIEARCGRS